MSIEAAARQAREADCNCVSMYMGGAAPGWWCPLHKDVTADPFATQAISRTRNELCAELDAVPQTEPPKEFTTGDDDLDRLLEITRDWNNPAVWGHDFGSMWLEAVEMVHKRLAAQKTDAKDAARYRWLKRVALEFNIKRQAVVVAEFIAPIAYGPDIDAAIDAAMAPTGPTP